MKCAIQLVFNDENQKKINELRKLLSDNGVHDEAVPINHISLADIEIEESQLDKIKQVLDNFAKEHKTINLVLSSVGSFMTNENVLFLTPTMTEDLLNYNDKLLSILSRIGISCGKYYTKNNWQPHCTVAIRLSDEELFKGFEILKKYNILPLEISADKIDLLRYNPKPYEELASFDFQK